MHGHFSRRQAIRIGALGTIASVAAACSRKPAVTAIGGTMDVIGPDARLSSAIRRRALPPDWYTEGTMSSTSLVASELDGLPALVVTPNTLNFAALRRVRARLLAMPFLTWSWRGTLPRNEDHPVRLVVGLSSKLPTAEREWFNLGIGSAAKINRFIEIVWSDSALKRGSMYGPYPISDGISGGRYSARGGPEQGATWQDDSVDIATVFSQFWPNDNVADTEVRYIGVRARAGNSGASMAISSVRLMR